MVFRNRYACGYFCLAEFGKRLKQCSLQRSENGKKTVQSIEQMHIHIDESMYNTKEVSDKMIKLTPNDTKQ